MTRLLILSLLCSLGSAASTLADTPPAPPAGLTEQMHAAVLAWLEKAPEQVDAMVPAAERVADKIIAGGNIYLTGNPGFVDEFENRAGGFPFAKPWVGGTGHTKEDVFLIGHLRPNEASLPYERLNTFMVAGRFKQSQAIFIASHQWPQVSRIIDAIPPENYKDRIHLIDTRVPAGGTIQDICVAQAATTALGWAFCGEVIAAATRKGHMLATYTSNDEADVKEWDASVKALRVHPKYPVAPIPAGQTGREYLRLCREQVAKFSTQAEPLRQAAGAMSKAMTDGGMVWIISNSHLHPRGSIVSAELLRMYYYGRESNFANQYLPRLPKQDMVLWMGYLRYPEGMVDQVLARGAKMVMVTADEGEAKEGVWQVRNGFVDFDAVVPVAGYPKKILPSSAVVQTPIWYSFMAEMMAMQEAAKRP